VTDPTPQAVRRGGRFSVRTSRLPRSIRRRASWKSFPADRRSCGPSYRVRL